MHTHEVINSLERVLGRVVDAETGERGFLITGRDNYLEPYDAALVALDTEVDHLATLVADHPAQAAAVASLRESLAAKLAQLQETIGAYRAQGPQAAAALIMTGRSKAAMDAIRLQVRGMQLREELLLKTRAAESEDHIPARHLDGRGLGSARRADDAGLRVVGPTQRAPAGRGCRGAPRRTRAAAGDAGQHRRRR